MTSFDLRWDTADQVDTRLDSLNSRYVKSFVEYPSAALLRPVVPAPSCEWYLRR